MSLPVQPHSQPAQLVDPTGVQSEGVNKIANYVWDSIGLAWVKETQPGGGGGGAVTIADGADVAQGTTTDAAWTSGSGTTISLLKKIASASGGNPASGLTGSAVPSYADYTGFNSGGNLVGVSSSNPLPITQTSQGVVSPGTAATTSLLTGGIYNASGITLTDGQQAALQFDANGDLQVGFNKREGASYVTATWNSSTAGNTTLVASTVGFGNTTFGVVCSGSISIGVVQFECTMDGTNWVPIGIAAVAGNPNQITSLSLAGSSVTGTYQMFVGGLYQVRIRLSTAITGAGTCKVMLRPSIVGTEFDSAVYQSTGSNLHVQVDSPLPALVAGNQIIGQIMVVDGAGSVNQLTVTGASTAAQATDKAVVVGLSPNSPLPSGTNAIGSVKTVDEATALIVESSTVTYVGNAAVGTLQSASGWKIKRLTSTVGGNLTIEWAGGSASYTNTMSSYAGYTYS